MKKLLIVCSVAFLGLLSTTQVNAQAMNQTYNTALGVKVWGDGGGITFKHFVKTDRAFEAIGYFWSRGARITGLYEFHFDFPDAPGLQWYVGPGAHVGFYNNRYYDNNPNNYPNSSAAFVGLDGVLGLDYKFDGVPINLSLDWQPSFEFGDGRGFYGGWGGLGIRYTFN
ncbi:MAG: hypothetical protein HOP08_14160 [Cyclobacteriaceae bacterium]|nr:hypothetical protein [Cyclobacteriaceae bacterium]